MPEAPQWARVRGEMNYHVRRGAWYEALRVTGEDAILEVNRRPVRLERSGLELSHQRPQRWSVVARPRASVDMPLSWGSPDPGRPPCPHPQGLSGQAEEPRCGPCRGA